MVSLNGRRGSAARRADGYGVGRGSERRQPVGAPDQRRPCRRRRTAAGRPARARIPRRLGQVQRREQQDRRDAGADRGLGHGHVDGIEHDQHAGHQEAVDAGQHDHAEQVAHAHDASVTAASSVSSAMLMSFYGCLPSRCVPSCAVRSSVSRGLPPCAARLGPARAWRRGAMKKNRTSNEDELESHEVKPACTMRPAISKPAPSVSVTLAACMRV